jgi:hypothetical protein
MDRGHEGRHVERVGAPPPAGPRPRGGKRGREQKAARAEDRLANLVEAGWKAGRFGPLTGSIRFHTRARKQLARAVSKLREVRS